MRVGDIVVVQDTNQFEAWRIEAVKLGALGQEGLVELRALTRKKAGWDGEKYHRTTWVPEPIVRRMDRYTPVEE